MAETTGVPDTAAPAPAGALQNFSLNQLAASPGVRQLAALVGIALAVALGVTVYMWSQQPAMQTLYSGLSDRDNAELIEALDSAGIAYRQDKTSGAILVAAADVHQARMALASEGLPRSAGGGFELIREEQGIGVSQFLENARYHHALETELARTISQLQPVRSARVHLALPKRSAFARSRQNAGASVLLSLYPGRRLEQGQVDAVVHLVASSIPDLLASNVSVVDEAGRLLSSSGDEGMSLSSTQLEFRSQLEDKYRSRIEQLLLPIMGPGRISAQVSVDLDFSQIEETRESYAPEGGVLRSEQLSENRDAELNAAGVPGALSNRAPAEGDRPEQDSSLRSRSTTRNFEIDRTVSRTLSEPGRMRRISAAVLVDHLPAAGAEAGSAPLSQEQLQQIEALVRQAIGFDAQRGDSVSVQNISFVPAEAVPDLDVPLWEQPLVMDVLRQLLGAIVLLVIAFLVLRPALKSALKAPPIQAQTLPSAMLAGGAGAALADEEDEDFEFKRGSNSMDKKLKAAREVVSEDPKRVAQLMKQWVGDE